MCCFSVKPLSLCVCMCLHSLGAIADLDLVIRSKNIEDDVMVVRSHRTDIIVMNLFSISAYLSLCVGVW